MTWVFAILPGSSHDQVVNDTTTSLPEVFQHLYPSSSKRPSPVRSCPGWRPVIRLPFPRCSTNGFGDLFPTTTDPYPTPLRRAQNENLTAVHGRFSSPKHKARGRNSDNCLYARMAGRPGGLVLTSKPSSSKVVSSNPGEGQSDKASLSVSYPGFPLVPGQVRVHAFFVSFEFGINRFFAL